MSQRQVDHLCHSFLLTWFYSSVESLPWDVVFHELLQHGSFPWAADPGHILLLLHGVLHGLQCGYLLQGLQRVSLLCHGPLHGLQGNLSFSTWSNSCPSFLVLVPSYFFLTPLSQSCTTMFLLLFLPFPRYDTTEAPPRLLMGSAMCCGSSAGSGCLWQWQPLISPHGKQS